MYDKINKTYSDWRQRMKKKKKLRKISLWLFIASFICTMAILFSSIILKKYPVVLNYILLFLLIVVIGGFSGSIIILFISFIIKDKQPESKAIKSFLKKETILCPMCGYGSKRVIHNKIYCSNCNAYYKSDKFIIKNNEQISKTERASYLLIKQDQKYKSIKDALEILQKDNYVLENIRTSGEFSSHDCIDSFSRNYSSFEEFTKNVNDDFAEKKKNSAAEVDWSNTVFTVINKDTGFEISFYYGEHNNYTFLSTWFTKETKVYRDDILKKLSSLIEEKNQE